MTASASMGIRRIAPTCIAGAIALALTQGCSGVAALDRHYTPTRPHRATGEGMTVTLAKIRLSPSLVCIDARVDGGHGRRLRSVRLGSAEGACASERVAAIVRIDGAHWRPADPPALGDGTAVSACFHRHRDDVQRRIASGEVALGVELEGGPCVATPVTTPPPDDEWDSVARWWGGAELVGLVPVANRNGERGGAFVQLEVGRRLGPFGLAARLGIGGLTEQLLAGGSLYGDWRLPVGDHLGLALGLGYDLMYAEQDIVPGEIDTGAMHGPRVGVSLIALGDHAGWDDLRPGSMAFFELWLAVWDGPTLDGPMPVLGLGLGY